MTCRSCDAKLSPVGDRHSEGHASIRFGDHALHVWKGDRLLRDCYEVEARLGLAWRYETPLRMCECGAGPAAYIDHGDFRVTTCLPQSPDTARNHVSGPQNACSVSEWPEHTFGGSERRLGAQVAGRDADPTSGQAMCYDNGCPTDAPCRPCYDQWDDAYYRLVPVPDGLSESAPSTRQGRLGAEDE